ncbi:MAG: hypothetical protein KatS3mg008_1606 [Acidimicrobiales bacterium]|nr:MAG: hypothetical protein KatS3mg008_1606 [Acidimicrobiales bacterium]
MSGRSAPGRRALGSVLVSAVLAATVGAVTYADPAAATSDLVQLIDARRREFGLAPLATHPELTSDSQAWAEHLAATGRLAHDPNFPANLSAPWWKAGETVGVSAFGAGDIVRLWMASPSHRSILLDPAMTHVGVGVVETGGLTWAVARFMRSGSPVATTTPPPAPPPPPPPPPTTSTTTFAAPATTTVDSTPPPSVTPTTPTTRLVVAEDHTPAPRPRAPRLRQPDAELAAAIVYALAALHL